MKFRPIRLLIAAQAVTLAVEYALISGCAFQPLLSAKMTLHSSFPLDEGTVNANAATIIATGRALGAGERDIIAALMVALVESECQNIDHGDKTSLGVFQQKPEYWGYASSVQEQATKFFHGHDAENGTHTPGLLDVAHRGDLALGVLCQRVQRSAFPDRYAQREGDARKLFSAAVR